MAGSVVDDDLWNEFHRVVNMTPEELADWLRTVPDHAGTPSGQDVLGILRKDRSDLTEEDVRLMRRALDRIHTERRADLGAKVGPATWRRRLMTLGHDPLRVAC